MPNRFRLDVSQMKCGHCDLIFLVEEKKDAFPFEYECPNCNAPASYMRSMRIVHDVESIHEDSQKGSGDTIMKRKVNTIRWRERMARKQTRLNKLDIMVSVLCGIFIGLIAVIAIILFKF